MPKTKPQQKKEAKKKQDKSKSTQTSALSFVLKNAAALLVLALVLNLALTRPGYNWLWNSLIKKNLELVNQNATMADEIKMEIKYGLFAKYLQHIKQNTPENAVILLPPENVVDGIPEKYKMKYLKNKLYCTYFLYPRQVLFDQTKDNQEATHVAIVNNWGYEHLNYPVRKKQPLAILPIRNQN